MTSRILRDARRYEEVHGGLVKEEDRPAFHLSPYVGWTNDPNGFSFYDGRYHLFYQYYPFSPLGGPIYWGHAASSDLLHWEYLPAALAPDTAYDQDGCFSGSALSLPDGRHLLMYTGVRAERGSGGEVLLRQVQCLAAGDGEEYEKYEGNPVITGDILPEGFSRIDFRDPKIWRGSDGVYRCAIGNRGPDDSGQILLFVSEDGFHWDYKKVLTANHNRLGKMWECPDFFVLDGHGVLLTSPEEMLPEGLEYHNGNGTICLIGDYEEKTDTFTEKHHQSVDYGIDFYAMQTTLTPDGRRVMIGWMQNWNTCHIREGNRPWFGQMSLPRELFIKEGRLYQRPIRELEELRHGKVEYENVDVGQTTVLKGVSGRKVDMELTLRPGNTDDIYKKFAVYVAADHRYRTEVCFRPGENEIKIDRKFSGSRKTVVHQRRAAVDGADGCLKLRIILDRFSMEIFVNDGEKVLSLTMYTDQSADGIEFCSEGSVKMDVVKYDL